MALAPPPRNLLTLALGAAKKYRLPPNLFLGLIQQESQWNSKAGSSAGAQGLTQLMPGTARGLGVTNITDPGQNLDAGARYLRAQLDRFKSIPLALSAYNSGPGGSESSGRVEGFTETQKYVPAVLGYRNQFREMYGMNPGGGRGNPPSSAIPTPSPLAASLSRPAESIKAGRRAMLLGLAQGEDIFDIIPKITAARSAVPMAPLSQTLGSTPLPFTKGQEPPATTLPNEGNKVPVEDLPHESHVNVEGFKPSFAQKLAAMIKASGGKLTIYSGYRPPEQQAQLFAAAVKKYGSEQAARKWVAPPGKSRHGHGDAADLRGDLAWAHKNAARFGLYFPMSWEDWHVEEVGSRG